MAHEKTLTINGRTVEIEFIEANHFSPSYTIYEASEGDIKVRYRADSTWANGRPCSYYSRCDARKGDFGSLSETEFLEHYFTALEVAA